MKLIRYYNNSLAFASFGAKLDIIPGQGPQVFGICQIYQNTYSLNPMSNEERNFGQLYIIDNEIANEIRSSTNLSCSKIILKEIDNILREINPYALAYKMMHRLEEGELKHARISNTMPREVKMYLTRKNCTNDKTRITIIK